MKALFNFMREEEGLTTVEYAVAGSLVAAAVIMAFTDLGEAVGTSITNITNCLTNSCEPPAAGG